MAVGVGGGVAVGVPVKVGRATATTIGGAVGVSATCGVSRCGTSGKTTSPSAAPKITLRSVDFQRV